MFQGPRFSVTQLGLFKPSLASSVTTWERTHCILEVGIASPSSQLRPSCPQPKRELGHFVLFKEQKEGNIVILVETSMYEALGWTLGTKREKMHKRKPSVVPHTYNKAGWQQVQDQPELQKILSQSSRSRDDYPECVSKFPCAQSSSLGVMVCRELLAIFAHTGYFFSVD